MKPAIVHRDIKPSNDVDDRDLKPDNADPDEVLDALGAAAFLKISRDALYDEVGRNHIPHRRIGKILRFSRTALMRWLDAPTYKEP